jgi:hypothetical protein
MRNPVTAEWRSLRALYRDVRNALYTQRLAAVPLTVLAVLLILLLQLVQHTAVGAEVVERLGVIQAALPLWQELLRTPLSLFVPARDLPVWGAALQVLVVFGIAEIALGRWRTLAVAYAGSLAGTLYARGAVRLGEGHPFGLPFEDAWVRDTGPSAAVVALAVCVAWRYRAWLTAGLVTLAMAVEEAAFPNLAGAEHLAAIACTAAVCGAGELATRQWLRATEALHSAAAVTHPVRRML